MDIETQSREELKIEKFVQIKTEPMEYDACSKIEANCGEVQSRTGLEDKSHDQPCSLEDEDIGLESSLQGQVCPEEQSARYAVTKAKTDFDGEDGNMDPQKTLRDQHSGWLTLEIKVEEDDQQEGNADRSRDSLARGDMPNSPGDAQNIAEGDPFRNINSTTVSGQQPGILSGMDYHSPRGDHASSDSPILEQGHLNTSSTGPINPHSISKESVADGLSTHSSGNLLKRDLVLKARRKRKLHMKKSNKNGKEYSCDLCSKALNTNWDLKVHMMIHTGERPHACDLCSKAFTTNWHLKEHMKTHTCERPHACDLCSKTFKRKWDLKDHMMIHTGEKPHVCDLCSKTFKRNGDLRKHMKIHTGERPHACDLCSKAFKINWMLNRHMMTHTGERPHACDLCSKAFKRIGDLNRHIVIHTGEKSYVCQLCSKAFKRNGDLKFHMQIHTGERPHACGLCSKTFLGKRNLKQHMKTHTCERPHVCDLCSKAFKRNGDLKKHMKIHTGERLHA